MASLRKAHNTWIACLTLGDGSRTTRSTGIKDLGTPKERAEAKRKALLVAQSMEELSRGNKTETQIRKAITDIYAKVNGKRVEFSKADAFLNNWLARVKLHKAESSYERYEGVVREFLASLGQRSSVPISEITPNDIQNFVDAGQRDGKKPKTLGNELKILSGAFTLALKQSLIVTNPIATADVPKEPGESKAPFTSAQVRAILKAATGDWKTACMFGAYTGGRLSDCANFTWANVDLEKKLLKYRPGKTSRHKKDVVCPLHSALYDYLLKLPSSDRPTAPITPALTGRYTGGRAGLSNEFDELLSKAGIANPFTVQGKGKGRAFRPLGFHSFRHTFKTTLINAGVAVETADVLTGHAKRTVSETYIHRSPKLLSDAIAMLPTF
jgi:integrase